MIEIRPWSRRKDNIKMDVKEIRYGVVDLIRVPQKTDNGVFL